MGGRMESPRIAILGAGPTGIEAALYAATLKLPVTVYERGRVAEHVRHWGHVRLFSSFGMNTTPLGRERVRADRPDRSLPGENDFVTGREHVEAYLEPLAKSPLLTGALRTETAVLSIGRRGFLKEDGVGDPRRGKQPFRLLLRHANKDSVEEVDIVLDCTGTYGQPRFLGDGGIAAIGEMAGRQQIAWWLEDVLGEKRAHYADRTTLVVGSGYSAATTICNLSALSEKHPATWIVWLARGAATQPVRRIMGDPLRERDQLAVRANMLATRGEGNVEFHAQAVVESIEARGPDKGLKVTARVAGKLMSWDVERMIANVGYTPNTEIYRELQVHECYATLGTMGLAAALAQHKGADCLTIGSQGAATLKSPEPGFFVLGAKSYGRNSNFLLRTGLEQVREVFTLITGKPDLDLYKKG